MDHDDGLIKHLSKFFPREAFERVAAARADPFEINEKRHAAVMFADISGFTAMSENLGAEEVSLLLSHIFTVLGERVAKYRGMIDKFLGDCILCVFGIADGSEPERDACLCALELMDALPGLNAWLSGKQGVYIDLTVGIHSGELVMGIIGSEDRLEFTVIGDTVNTASRVQHEAEPGQILVTEAVRRKVAPHFVLAHAGERRLKNKREALAVFRLEGLSLQRATDPGREPIGREGELDYLLGLAGGEAAARGGFGNASVLIHGDAGTGKTLLLNWLCRKAADQASTAVLRLQGERYHAEISGQALRAALAQARGTAFASAGNRDALRLAFFDLAQERAGGSGFLLLAVDDAQYLDEDSRSILEGLLRDLSDARLLLVATQRGAEPPFGAVEASLRLEGLDGASAGELCERTLGSPCSEMLRSWVHRASQGNPHYIQEVLCGLREAGQIARPGQVWDFVGEAPRSIPSGLAGLILQKLELLPFAQRRIARYASLCGSGIPVDLLAALTGLSAGEVESFLVRAEELEIARMAKEGGKTILRFLHGTAQEAIAGSILSEAAGHMHLEIARALLDLSRASGPSAASLALAATHFELGGDPEGAVFQFFRASEGYKAAHDFISARRQLERAIALAGAFPEGKTFGRVSFRDADINTSFASIPLQAELDPSILHFTYALSFLALESECMAGLDRAVSLRRETDLVFYRMVTARLHNMNYLGRIGIDDFERSLSEAAEKTGGEIVGFYRHMDLYYGLLSALSYGRTNDGLWERMEAEGARLEELYQATLKKREAEEASWGNLRALRASIRILRHRLEGNRRDEDRTQEIVGIMEEGLSSLDLEADRLSFIQSCYPSLERDTSLRIRYELQCIDLAEAVGSVAIQAQMHSAVGYDCLELGDSGRALAHFARAVEICLKAGWRYELSMARYNLSMARLLQGDWGRALEEARSAAELREEFPVTLTTMDYTSLAWPLVIQAAALFLMGRRDEAGKVASRAGEMDAIKLQSEKYPLCAFIRDAAEGFDLADEPWRERLEALRSSGSPATRAFADALEAEAGL